MHGLTEPKNFFMTVLNNRRTTIVNCVDLLQRFYQSIKRQNSCIIEETLSVSGGYGVID